MTIDCKWDAENRIHVPQTHMSARIHVHIYMNKRTLRWAICKKKNERMKKASIVN